MLSLEFTENNHFEYGRLDSDPEVFFSKVGAPNRALQNGFAESVLAAKKIHANANGQPVDLCLSGGVDSEAMFMAFRAAGVPFRVNILRFKDELNDFDIINAIDYVRSYSIDLRIIEMDVFNFFESGLYLEYGRKYNCQSPQLAAHMWMLDQIEGLPVLSGNFIYAKISAEQVFYIGLPGDLHCAYFRYFEKRGRLGVPWFFLYTAEQSMSFLRAPTKEAFSYDIKCRIYKEAGFSVLARADKYTGFEKVRTYYDEKFGATHGSQFDLLYRRPLEMMNPFPKEYLQLVPMLT